MKSNTWLAIIAILLMMISQAFAWNDTKTHPHITKMALQASSINQYFQDQLMIAGGMDARIDGKSVIEWLQYGAEKEDTPACRASNHFHDPYRSWVEAGLTDKVLLVDWYCWLFSPFPPEEISSNLVWATGYLNRSGTGIDLQNEWDQNISREYFYTYLTGKDFVGNQKACTLDERNEYLANTLREERTGSNLDL